MFYAAAWPYAAMRASSMMLSVLEALAFFFDASRSAQPDASEAKKKIAPTED